MEFLHYILELLTAAAVLFPIVKRYVIGEEYVPHIHTERGPERPLTAGGIMYPRGTKKRATA